LLTFAPGVTTQPVSVTVLEDLLDEDDETFVVDLSGVTGGAVIGDGQGEATITDNDALPTLSIGDVVVGEAAGVAQFVVTLSALSGRAVQVDYTTRDSTATLAGLDYTLTSGTLVIAAGSPSGTFDVPINDDALSEGEEAFVVDLSSPVNATIADGYGVGAITDNEGVPSLSIDDVVVDEADGTAGFTVTLTPASSQTVTVNYATADVTATAGSDYTAVASTLLTFAPGVTTQPVSVTVLEDLLDEDDETFVVDLRWI
jgi:hypothetical protein